MQYTLDVFKAIQQDINHPRNSNSTDNSAKAEGEGESIKVSSHFGG